MPQELIWFQERPQADGYYIQLVKKKPPRKGQSYFKGTHHDPFDAHHHLQLSIGRVETVTDERNEDYWLKDGSHWKCVDGKVRRWGYVNNGGHDTRSFRTFFSQDKLLLKDKKEILGIWFASLAEFPPEALHENNGARQGRTKPPKKKVPANPPEILGGRRQPPCANGRR